MAGGRSRTGKWRSKRCEGAAARLAAVAASAVAGISIAHAQTTYIGPSGGSWDTTGNWSSGIPDTGSDAFITEAPTSALSVNFDGNYTSATAIGELVLDSSSASGGVELNQTTSGDNLFSATEIVGNAGPGSSTYNQSAATNNVTSTLYVGDSASASGSYSLSGTGSLSAGVGYVGYSGNGTFTQSGGNATFTGVDIDSNGLSVGDQVDSNGTYILSGGTLGCSEDEQIGTQGTGSFIQSGGTNSANLIVLGGYAGAIGTYSLSNGSVAAASDYIGGPGSGTFIQSGGTNSVSGALALGLLGGESGTYNQAGGDVTAGTLVVGSTEFGNSSTGVFSLAGNALLSAGSAEIGDYGSGTIVQNGGSATFTGTGVNGNSLDLGNETGTGGTYVLNAGSLGCYDMECVGNRGAGTFIQGGGTNSGVALILGNAGGSSGLYSLSNGSVTAAFIYVGSIGTGTFFQSGGTNSVTSELMIGSSQSGTGTYIRTGGSVSTPYLDMATSFGPSTSAVTSTSVYSLSGSATLSAGVGYIGDGQYCVGIFVQGGGTASFTASDSNSNSLSLGNQAGSTGYYVLSGNLGCYDNESIGTSGAGTFIQAGGSNSAQAVIVGNFAGSSGTYLQIGGSVTAGKLDIASAPGSTGAYSLAAESLPALSAGIGYIGDGGNGTFVQSGGTVSFTSYDSSFNSLYLGYQTGSDGQYLLSGGTLYTTENEWIGNNGAGTFIQNGGLNSAENLGLGDNAGSGGSYTLSNGVLSTLGCDVGASGTGTFIQSGGTALLEGLDVGVGAGGSGLYSLSGSGASTLIAIRVVIVGDSGSGTVIQSGGSVTSPLLTVAGQLGSNGTYILSGGSFSCRGKEYIGLSGAGTFIQSGGTNSTPSQLVLGESNGSSGTYILSGGTLSLSSQDFEYIGNHGSGTFIQTGGINDSGTNLYVGGGVLGGAGVYEFSGGALNPGGDFTVISNGSVVISGGNFNATPYNNGSVIQTGGTAVFGDVGGNGTISIGNPSGTPAAMTVGGVGQNAVTILSTGELTISANSSGPNTLNALTITGNGTLNLTNNALYIEYGSNPDPVANIQGYLASGYNGGNWNGLGIDTTSSTGNKYGIGYADSADAGNPAGLSSDTIEVKYTLYGDANLDGVVNSVDFGILAANFGTSGKSWDQGAFTYNGEVNSVDFGLLAANFGQSASGTTVEISAADWAALDAFAEANGLMSEVPEPAGGGLLLLGAVGGLGRRRRREARG